MRYKGVIDRLTENEKKKQYLSGYKNLCLKLRSLEEQLQSLREVEESAKIQKLSDMPKGGKQTDLSDLMVRIEIIFTKIVRLRGECLKLRIEIENRIADIPDGMDSLILHKRYIEFKIWEQIGEELGYSGRQIINLHGRALINFNIS
ncbi:MAG TPA: hypothetical protein GXX75_23390 [Clostridiales bacterium]|nr:hypothetical protein [Clostridiales bacterium]